MGIALFKISCSEVAVSMRSSVIRPLVGSSRDGYCLRVDGKRTYVGSYSLVVAFGAGLTALDRIGVSVVVSRVVGNVGNASRCCGDRQNVAVGQSEYLTGAVSFDLSLTVLNGVGLILMQLAVIGPLVCRRSDNECSLVLGDLQSSVNSGNCVVAYCCCGSGGHCNAVYSSDHVRLCALIGDRAVSSHCNCEGVGIAPFKISCSEVAVSVRSSVIRPLVGSSCDGDCLRIDGQRTYVGSYALVVAFSAGLAALDRVGVSVVLVCVVGNVGNASRGCGYRQNVAVGQFEYLAGAVSLDFSLTVLNGVGLVLVQFAVIGPFSRSGCDHQCGLVLSDGQLTGCSALKCVVLGDIGLAVLDGQSRRVISAVGVGPDSSAACRCIGDRNFLVVYKAAYGLLALVGPGPAVLNSTVVRQ